VSVTCSESNAQQRRGGMVFRKTLKALICLTGCGGLEQFKEKLWQHRKLYRHKPLFILKKAIKPAYGMLGETNTTAVVDRPQCFNSLSVSVATDAGLNLDSGFLLLFFTCRLQTVHLHITTR